MAPISTLDVISDFLTQNPTTWVDGYQSDCGTLYSRQGSIWFKDEDGKREFLATFDDITGKILLIHKNGSTSSGYISMRNTLYVEACELSKKSNLHGKIIKKVRFIESNLH